ncbi:hypothetical protein AB0K35_27975 [Micromonospora sp. NPDC053740]|uniref:hypothetical protein n=1 Tax=Micromonospora sp. NPDC053740 TaxID=3155173 RepID=UPI003432EC2B
MTKAPATLLGARKLLLDHLGSHGLQPAEVGVVGDTAHQKQGDSYHLGKPEQRSTGYSVSESPRDKAGLSELAAGLDIGDFAVSVAGKRHTLASFSIWLVAQCKANSPDTRDIREVIYSPDGSTVKRWDRLGKRSTGDSSHRRHTHISYFRDAIKAGRDQTALFRRYLQSIGLIKAPTTSTEGDEMTPEEHNWLAAVHKNLTVLDGRNPIGQIYTRMSTGEDATDAKYVPETPTLKSLGKQLTALQTALTALAGRDFTDEPAIVQGVLASLTPEKIAAAIPAAMAKQVADELARRLTA